MIRAMAPTTDIGLLIVQEATPDVGTYPEFARFSWLKPSTGDLKYYNGSSWQYAKTSTAIPSGSITIALLSASGGSPYQIMAVNSSGTAITFQNLASLLATPAYADLGFGTQKFLTISGGVCKVAGVDPSAFVAKSIALSKILSTGAAGYYLTSDGAGGWLNTAPPSLLIPDKSLTISKLSSSGAPLTGDVIRADGLGGFSWYTLPTYSVSPPCYASSAVPPDPGGTIEFTHGLGGMPNYFRATLVRWAAATVYGYAQNDEMDLNCVTSQDDRVAFSVCADSNKVYVTRTDQAEVYLMDRTSGARTSVALEFPPTIGDWWIKIYANRFV